jgi:hypothetical protein
MLLTEKQKNGLTKFIKLVLSRRTAASISELIASPVVLEVEEVSLHPLSRLTTEFADILNNEVTTVHQMFAGSMSGDALLMLDYEVAVMLTNLLRHNSDILRFRQSKIAVNSGGSTTITARERSQLGAGSREQGAGSREQGAGSREQGAGSREQGAGSRERVRKRGNSFFTNMRCTQ